MRKLTVDGLEQLLALVLPLELGYPGLFGDDLQLTPGLPRSSRYRFASAGEYPTSHWSEERERDDPEESPDAAGVGAGAGAGFHRILEIHKETTLG